MREPARRAAQRGARGGRDAAPATPAAHPALRRVRLGEVHVRRARTVSVFYIRKTLSIRLAYMDVYGVVCNEWSIN